MTGLRPLVWIVAALALLPGSGAAMTLEARAGIGADLALAGFSEEIVVSGLVEPTALAFLPDGRILVAEKRGVVRVVKGGRLLARPFIDISDHVNAYYERGLLGLAADPDFADNGAVYLLYAFESDGDRPKGTKTARLTRVSARGDAASPAGEHVVLGTAIGDSCAQFPPGSDCVPNDWYGHSVGDIAFARNGTLFVSVGDASTWDAATEGSLRAQSLDSLAGKILHVTREGDGLASNPFWNGDPAAARSKVWAYGVRNAFRMAVQPLTGALYAADVGWESFEEIDVVPAGANLGWPCYEGPKPQPRYEAMGACQTLYAQGPAAVAFPLVALGHGSEETAIAGTAFATGRAFPRELRGALLYGDYVQGSIRYVKVDRHGRLLSGPALFAGGADGPVDLQMGPDGSLYYLAFNAGQLRRIRYGTEGNQGPVVSGLFGRRVDYQVGPTPHSVVAADLNRDGRLDLVAADATSSEAGVLRAAGKGTFLPVQRFPTGAKPKFVLARDLNGDGKLDLASANQNGSTVSVLLGNGDGTFGNATDYPVCSRAHEVAAADLNADRRVDLAVACWDGTVVSVLLGRGDGTFGRAIAFESGGNPHSLVIRDLDGDRRPDIAVANHGSDDVSVLLGEGDGTFGPPVRYPVGSRPHSVRAGDLNDDGALDLVTANDGSDDVSVLLGRGDGRFRGARSYRAGRVPKSVTIADLNGDGKLDVATANTGGNGDGVTGLPGGNNISVLLGRGTGALRSPILYLVGQTPFSVTAADLNRDRRVDLATANWDGGTVTVLLGRRTR